MKHLDYDQKTGLSDLVIRYKISQEKGHLLSLEIPELIRLSNYLIKENQPELAIELLEHGIQQHPSSGKLHFKLAKIHISNFDYHEGLKYLDLAEARCAPPRAVDFQRAHAYAGLGQYDDSLHLIHHLKYEGYQHNRKRKGQLFFLEAWIYEKQENFDKVFFALKDALMEDHTHAGALERMWVTAELCRRHKESIKLHNHLLGQDPYMYRAWFNLGHAYYSNNDYQEAIEAFEMAFLINDQFELAYRDYAELCFEMRQYEKALNCYLSANKQFNTDVDILTRIGQCLYYLNDPGRAKIYLFKALNLDRRNEEVSFQIGECYALEQQWGSAVHFYNQAIRLNDDRDDYLFALAKASIHLGRKKRATHLFSQAIELAPDQIEYWLCFARFLLKEGKKAEAVELMEEAVLNAYCAETCYGLAACLFKSGERVRGLNMMGEGLQENFSLYKLFFEIAPEFCDDRDLAAIIKYYRLELAAAETEQESV